MNSFLFVLEGTLLCWIHSPLSQTECISLLQKCSCDLSTETRSILANTKHSQPCSLWKYTSQSLFSSFSPCHPTSLPPKPSTAISKPLAPHAKVLPTGMSWKKCVASTSLLDKAWERGSWRGSPQEKADCWRHRRTQQSLILWWQRTAWVISHPSKMLWLLLRTIARPGIFVNFAQLVYLISSFFPLIAIFSGVVTYVAPTPTCDTTRYATHNL